MPEFISPESLTSRCLTPGLRIRSKGQGRGWATGGGRGPIGVPIGRKMGLGQETYFMPGGPPDEPPYEPPAEPSGVSPDTLPPGVNVVPPYPTVPPKSGHLWRMVGSGTIESPWEYIEVPEKEAVPFMVKVPSKIPIPFIIGGIAVVGLLWMLKGK